MPAAGAHSADAAAPFTGVHYTDWTASGPTAPNGPFAAGGNLVAAQPSTIEAAPADARLRSYVGLDFIYMKQTGPRQEPRLIQLSSTTGFGAPPNIVDTYRAGTVNTGFSAGFRWVLGRWVSDDVAIEIGGMYLTPFFYKRLFLAGTSTSVGFTGATTTTTAVTFLPTSAGLAGANVDYRNGHFGFEANARRALWCSKYISVDGIVGVRYQELFERFNFDLARTPATDVMESFDSSNDIIGGQVGTQVDVLLWEYVSLRGFAKYVGGVDFQHMRIGGPTTGGLLTGPNNLGRYDRTEFSNFVDFGLMLAARLTPHIESTFGCYGMYYGDLVRSANAIDPAGAGVDPRSRIGSDTLWLLGFTAGLKIEF